MNSRRGGLVLGVQNGNWADGTPIDQAPYVNVPTQQWNVSPTGDGYYSIGSLGIAKYFDGSSKNCRERRFEREVKTLHRRQACQRRWSRWGIFGVLASALVALVAPLAPASAQSARAVVTVQAGQRGKKISPDLLGIFFEDINYAADGGLYAELIQNRSFEYSNRDRWEWNPLTAWELVQRGGGKGGVAVESAASLHASNPNYALLTVEQGGSGVGLRNSGFDGIALKAGERYHLSCFARRQSGEPAPLVVTLESKTGTVYGTATFATLTKDWRKYSATIPSSGSDTDARLVIGTAGVGAVALDMISLFPRTFRNRPNGLRADLAQTIADLKPKFMRFPGGCIAHGDRLDNVYPWKNTIGPVETRKGLRSLWGYHQSFGLGYFEYFQFCEDIGAKPLPVVAAGVTCQFRGPQQCIPLADMDEYIQDVLDLIEWANGPVTSPWGAKRAAAGHPKPFHLEYLGVGNEDAITPEFRQRFEMIYKAVKARYPKVAVIGTAGPFAGGPDFDEGWKLVNKLKVPLVDEHYYVSPEWLLGNLNRYDSYSRARSKVYLGEWASRGNTLFNALAEAAYLAALEKNGDIVHLASYAPLLANTRHQQWWPNLIYFDNTTVLPSVNYYVQQLYGRHSGDTYLPSTVSLTPPTAEARPVSAFVGTWNTQAEFQNVRLQSGPNSMRKPTSAGADWDWSEKSGAWKVEGGVYRQTGEGQPALRKVAGAQVTGPNYTLSLRARKTGGSEGFLIGFGATDASNYYWWNLGGWNNTQHGVQRHRPGLSDVVGKPVPGRIETGRWYDIKIVVSGQHIRCFLDGRLIHDLYATPNPPVSAFVGTWNTQAQFRNVRLQSGPNSVLIPRTAGPYWDWNERSGTWKVENGVYSQTGEGQPALRKVAGAQVAGVGGKPSYTLSLRARKTGGQEGFLIGFGATDASNYYWWNLGGWNNTQHGVQRLRPGLSYDVVGQAKPGRIEPNRWYDIKIVVNGPHIRCYLDGKLIHDLHDTLKLPEEIVVASSVRDTKTGDIILKLVNVTPFAVQSRINLVGSGAVQPTATRIVLSGEKPRSIVPQTAQIRVGRSFSYAAPPHSFTVIRVQTR